jgi:hypothetical protein
MKRYFRHILFIFAVFLYFSGYSKGATGATDNPAPFWRTMDQDALVHLIGDREMLFLDRRAGHNTVAALTVVQASPEEVWPLVGEYKNYSKLIHEFIEVKPDKGEIVHLRLQGLKVGPVSMYIDFYAKPEAERPSRFTLKYLKGKTQNAQISWELIPIDEGKSTVLVFILSGAFEVAGAPARSVAESQPGLGQATALAVAGAAARQIKTIAETEK